MSSDIRREWARLCNSSVDSMSQLYDEEIFQQQINCSKQDCLTTVDVSSAKTDVNVKNRRRLSDVHVKEMMITQERPLGCDDSTIDMLTKLDTKVSLISKSVQFIYNTSHQTIQKIQSLITEEKKTNEEQNKDKNEN